MIENISARGARVVRGGQAPPDLSKGYFYEPTLIEVTDPERQRFESEIFGPLATVTRVRDLDHAIELANDSNFGLGANIYTSNLETAMRAATELQAGTVWINDPLKDNDAAPFGGMKFSGPRPRTWARGHQRLHAGQARAHGLRSGALAGVVVPVRASRDRRARARPGSSLGREARPRRRLRRRGDGVDHDPAARRQGRGARRRRRAQPVEGRSRPGRRGRARHRRSASRSRTTRTR